MFGIYFLEIEKSRPVNQMYSDEEKTSDVEFFAATLLGGALEHHEEFWEKDDHSLNCSICRLVRETAMVTNLSIADIKLEFDEQSETLPS